MGVSGLPDYGDKRAYNKQAGPGCDSPRLHQHLSGYRRECGADQDRRMCKNVTFTRMGSVIRPLTQMQTITLHRTSVWLRNAV